MENNFPSLKDYKLMLSMSSFLLCIWSGFGSSFIVDWKVYDFLNYPVERYYIIVIMFILFMILGYTNYFLTMLIRQIKEKSKKNIKKKERTELNYPISYILMELISFVLFIAVVIYRLILFSYSDYIGIHILLYGHVENVFMRSIITTFDFILLDMLQDISRKYPKKPNKKNE